MEKKKDNFEDEMRKVQIVTSLKHNYSLEQLALVPHLINQHIIHEMKKDRISNSD
jgi:hypothetical protein